MVNLSSEDPAKGRMMRKRKRGITASRAKLTKAMANAGLKTQTALAEHIASLENLESAPKDFVSKIFREQPVEASSLERIASALGVEAYKLYKTKQDTEIALQLDNDDRLLLASDESIVEHQTFPSYQLLSRIRWFLLLCAITVASYWWINKQNASELNTSAPFSHIPATLGRLSLLIVGQPNEINEPIQNILGPMLGEEFNVSNFISIESNLVQIADFQRFATQYQSDLVLQLNAKVDGNFIALDAWLYAENQVLHIWSANPRLVEFNNDVSSYWRNLQAFISFSLGKTERPAIEYTLDVKREARDYYLEGRNLLDQSQAELNFKSAQSRFIHALNIAPNYAEAHAALCEALVLESWMGNEKNLLEEAQQACALALRLSPQNRYVLSVVSYLYRRTGRVYEALQLLDTTENNNDIDLLLGRAYTFYEAYRQDIDVNDALVRAKSYAVEAISLAPQFWKPYHALGLIELSLGDTQAAINAFGQAVRFDANELMLANLGTLNFCRDNLEQALENYQLAMQFAPESHLGPEMMGMVKYFQGEYSESLKLRLQAANSIKDAGIHQIWGAIADTYLQLGQIDSALANYQHALTLVERDKLRGNLSLTDQAHQLYYQLQVDVLSGNSDKDNNKLDNQLFELEQNLTQLDSSAIVKLALIEQQRRHDSKVRSLLASAVSICPVYLRLPQFKQQADAYL